MEITGQIQTDLVGASIYVFQCLKFRPFAFGMVILINRVGNLGSLYSERENLDPSQG